ncbi:MAP3K14 [Branchiostoma lanceolatum]|uniref:MAP3K14 protein n=1 Tax=Branchiostoma lanceolatum TaxID=7740 RepID=A0A8J9WE90_BRALA|nr:MAP3K14 [Branchiostoma lanceolatum]
MNIIIDGLSHGHTSLSEWQNCSEASCMLCLSYLQHVKSRRCRDKEGCTLCIEVCKAMTKHYNDCSSEACCISFCHELKSSTDNRDPDENKNNEAKVSIKIIRPLLKKLLTEETQGHRKSVMLPDLYTEHQGVEDVPQTDFKDAKNLLARGCTEDLTAINSSLNNLSLRDVQSTPGVRNVQGHNNMQTATNQSAMAAYLEDTNMNVTGERNESLVRYDLPPGVMGPPTFPQPLNFPELSNFSTPGLGYVAKGTPVDVKTFSQYWAGLTDAEKVCVPEEGVLFHEKLTPINGRYTQDEHWQLGLKIGGGSQGCCYLTVDLRTQFICAVKQVPPPGYRAEEIEIWGELVHPKINRMYGILRERNFYYFMEYIYGDTLAEFVKVNKKLSEEIALECLEQILEGLVYLHKRRIIHGDIKGDNIVVTEKGEAIVLIDFGLARQLPHNVSAVPRGEPATGTYAYQSPEVRFRLGHDCKADVWSAVCVLYFMLEGATPSFDFSECKYYCPRFPCPHSGSHPFSKADLPDSYSEKLKDIFFRGLHYDPGLRASAEQLQSILGQ